MSISMIKQDTICRLLAGCLAFLIGNCFTTSLEAQTRDLTGKVVLANADKHKVTFRAGKTQKDINPGRFSNPSRNYAL